MATLVRSGYSDFGQNWKVSKTCCFASNWFFWWKYKILNVSEEFEGNFQHLKKLNQKNQPWKWVRSGTAILVKIENSAKHADCFGERTTFWMFQKNWKGIFNISKNQAKKSTNKMATPVRSGYNDFGQNWKVRKTCCFCFKLVVLMKEQHFECFSRIGRVFSTFQKTQPKKSTMKMGQVRYSDFGQNWKLRKTCWLFWWKNNILNVSEELEGYFQHFKKSSKKMATPVSSGYSNFRQNWKVRKTCWLVWWKNNILMFQKNWKGIFNISKNQPKKSTNKMATSERSGYSDFGQNWKVSKTSCFCFKLIVLMKEQHFECFRRIGRAFSTFEKLNQKNQPTKWPRR